MNRKGFTLIELLAVITILSLVALVTSISVANMVKESKNELSSTQMKSIKAAAESWGADNISDLPTGNSCSYITLNDLKDEGLLDSNITDPKNKSIISNDLKIKITSKLNGKGKSIISYEVNPTNTNNCTYIGSPLYVDVPDGLTPVIYVDESTEDEPTKGYWKVPEFNEEWYNYDEQMWANAVVLGKGKSKKPGEKVKVEGEHPEALMMLVYIPRYEYRIVGQYGTHSNGVEGTAESPGEIEVKFINNSQTKADDDYILHPAFDFGGQQLSGIWVGKFELSHNVKTNGGFECGPSSCPEAAGLEILPNKSSLTKGAVSSFYYIIKSIEINTSAYGLYNVDTHMMKNSEWGAVAYLSQSRYGKYENSNYEGANKRIYCSGQYITGNSSGVPTLEDSSYTDCSYNKMTDLGLDENNYKRGQCGPGGSTTGTIYGIYDMNGSNYEYLMGAYGTDYPTVNSSESLFSNDTFTSETINKKYYDLYKTSNLNTACNTNEECLGHALSETNGWYGISGTMLDSTNPWVERGSRYSSSIFLYNKEDGSAKTTTSSRAVFTVK